MERPKVDSFAKPTTPDTANNPSRDLQAFSRCEKYAMLDEQCQPAPPAAEGSPLYGEP